MLIVNRSIDSSSSTTIKRDTAEKGERYPIEFLTIEMGEESNVCKPQPEAYVIDTPSDWNVILDKLRSDCNGNIRDSPIPSINFEDKTVLIYFWGQKPNSGNNFSIVDIEADPNAFSVLIKLEFKDGFATALSYPYIIASIPKTHFARFVFDE